MKLAEALRERKQLQIKMGTLRQKLIDNAIYQEGSKPVEDPAELIKALVDFSHYFRWLFANFRECSLIS